MIVWNRQWHSTFQLKRILRCLILPCVLVNWNSLKFTGSSRNVPSGVERRRNGCFRRLTRNVSGIGYQCPKGPRYRWKQINRLSNSSHFLDQKNYRIFAHVTVRWITANLKGNLIKGNSCLTWCLHTWSFLYVLCWLWLPLLCWSWMFEWIDECLRSTML